MALVVRFFAFHAALSAAVTVPSDSDEAPVRRMPKNALAVDVPVRRQVEVGVDLDADGEPWPIGLRETDGPQDDDGESWPTGLAESTEKPQPHYGKIELEAAAYRKTLRARFSYKKQACNKDKACVEDLKREFATLVNAPNSIAVYNYLEEAAYRKLLRGNYATEKKTCTHLHSLELQFGEGSERSHKCVKELREKYTKMSMEGPPPKQAQSPSQQVQPPPQQVQPPPQQVQPPPQQENVPPPQQQAPPPQQEPVSAPQPKHVSPPQKHVHKPVDHPVVAPGPTVARPEAPQPSTSTRSSVVPIVAGLFGVGLILGICLWKSGYMKEGY